MNSLIHNRTAKKPRMESNPPHVLAFPLPKQGHINPLLQFSKRLASRRVQVTLLIPSSLPFSLPPNSHYSIQIATIPGAAAADPNVTTERFRAATAKALEDFICNSSSDSKPKLVVYDSVMPWIFPVAKRFGIEGVPFFTQSCAVNHIFELIYRGDLEIPPAAAAADGCVSVPYLPILEGGDLPIWFPGGALAVVKSFKAAQFGNLKEVKWMLCNTFDKLESAVVDEVASKWRMKTVGPNVPSAYLDKRLENDESYRMSWSSSGMSDATIEWLNSNPPNSVLYVSFGTVVSLEPNQVKEIASILRDGSNFFIWVMGDSEKQKLPTNFLSQTSKIGLVISWCSQLQVLAHAAVGCFVTHCGWNSTLEALSCGVPMVAVPKWSDQTTNAKFIVDVWGVGVRAKVNGDAIFTAEEIGKCIREVMEGDRGKEIRKNCLKWKELAKEAVDEGGSSDRNIDDFVKELLY